VRLLREDLGAEFEEFPLLEAVTRKRLKTQQAEKDLSGVVVICKVREFCDGAVITCSSEMCV
jgi:hypothetical protein